MDQLSYKYIYANTSGGNGEYVPGQAPTSGVSHLTNQLSSIQDAVTGNSYAGDIKSQSAFNYTYDAIGELTGDAQQEISNVTWNVYGKILSLSDSGNTITFTYDAAGNRISKAVTHGSTTVTTWYVRDAQGNVMSVYTQGNSAVNSGALTQTEAHLYGSSRLGLLDLSVNCGTSLTQPGLRSLVRGNKLFELTNHLGNVLETISDKKVQHTSDNSTVDYYLADVINANDYYSFGMGMPVRTFNASTAANYRYGFNGKEQDPEVKGAGDQYDYGMRMYDPRVGRFLSVDPLTPKYAYYTPYQFAGNTPIWASDLDGLEPKPTNDGTQEGQTETTTRTRGGARGMLITDKTQWFWHAGSKEYGTKAGWYTAEGYQNILTPIAQDLAGYQGLLTSAANSVVKNWTPDQKADIVNTRLGRFIGNGLSDEAATNLMASAEKYANDRNAYVTGVIAPSSFNVEDMALIGVGLLKGGVKLLTSTTTKDLAINEAGKEAKQLLLTASEDIHRHHVLPQEFKAWFKARGISKIDNYTVEISAQTHLRGVHGNGLGNLPGQWNEKWAEFIRANPNATPSEIFNHAEGLLKQYGLEHLPYIPYRK
jgi:RHS repeat-associated protein